VKKEDDTSATYMLTPKTKGLFVEINSFSLLVAVTSSLRAPFEIESIREFSIGDGFEAFRSMTEELRISKTARYFPARCGIYPSSRFFKRFTLDNINKAKEPTYFVDIIRNQFRLDPDKNLIALISAIDGMSFNVDRGLSGQKELLFCGALRDEILAQQQQLVGWGVFPERLELGSLSTMGAIQHFQQVRQQKGPTLILELAPEQSHLYIVSKDLVELCRPISHGLNAMLPIIRSELGLKDEESARKLLYSNTFDFTEMGPSLLGKILKEIQASTGFYEVQTGQSIQNVYLPMIPKNLGWIRSIVSRTLGIQSLKIDFVEWLAGSQIRFNDSIEVGSLDERWFDIFSLMGDFSPRESNVAEKK
jgi:hypothetical protein